LLNECRKRTAATRNGASGERCANKYDAPISNSTARFPRPIK